MATTTNQPRKWERQRFSTPRFPSYECSDRTGGRDYVLLKRGGLWRLSETVPGTLGRAAGGPWRTFAEAKRRSDALITIDGIERVMGGAQ